MNVETPIIVVFLSAIVGLQGWSLISLVDLKIKIASITEHCKFCKPKDL